MDIEKVFKQRNWWDLLINLKIAKHITLFIANHTKLTPNHITMISFAFAFIAGVFFFKKSFILGAIFFQISYILDIVDGALARFTEQTSKFGAFLDVVTDWIKAPLLIVILLYRQEQLLLIVILLLLSFGCFVSRYNDMLFYTTKKSLSTSQEVSSSKIGRYLNLMKQKHIQPFPSTIEFEAMVLFFYPIFKIKLFLYLGILILLFNIVLKLYAILKKIS